jgi:colanic acid/amylovoran biosynthesis glycosyltransferase
LKVAVITESFPKLSETFIANHIKGLVDAGVEVKIFSFNDSGEDRMHPVIMEYRLREICQYKPAEPDNKLSRMLKAMALILRYFFQYPKAVLQSVNFFAHGLKALRFRYLFEIGTFFSKEKFDIIHCHFGPMGEKISLYQQWGVMKAPVITSFHGYDVDDISIRNKDNYRQLKKKGALYICNSAYTKRRMIELGFDEKKISILPVCFDTVFFSRKGDASADTFSIITVSRLVEFKGIEYSIKALALAKQEYNIPFTYTIVGTGPLRDHLQALIYELEMGDCIHLAGSKTQDEILALMNAAHIFLLTGILAKDGRQENQGLVIQEAQAMELPVIVSDVGGVSEGMVDGQTGFLLEQKNIQAVAERIFYLYTHPIDRKNMGIAGRRFVENRYSISHSTTETIKLYNTVLS